MKSSSFFHCRTTHLITPIYRFSLFVSIVFFCIHTTRMYAQQDPVLSIQGILKKASGEAVSDGNYTLTFRLYENPDTGQPVWEEEQMNVEVISGIYSTVLGNIEPLDVEFDTTYFLGVTVGSTEMKPRVQLTSAPYALALIGSSNKFPSSGLVQADALTVKDGVLASVGAPGNNGTNNNGYAFNGMNGDKDSGLFSTALGQVSLYVNNEKMMTASPDSVAMRSDLRFNNDANINYNGLDDWRLVEADYFQTDAEGWQMYSTGNDGGDEWIGWQNGTPAGAAIVTGSATAFQGSYIRPNDNNQVLKKFFNLANVGDYTFIKAKFKYHFIDTWGFTTHDEGFAGFATAANGTGLRIGWLNMGYEMDFNGKLGTPDWQSVNDYSGGVNNSDYSENVEITGFKNGTGFWLFIGSALDQPTSDESYGVGMIEIWVK